jgi:hypothetical protein
MQVENTALSCLIILFISRYDHVRPKPQASIAFHPVPLRSIQPTINPSLQQNFINTKPPFINDGGKNLYSIILSRINFCS